MTDEVGVILFRDSPEYLISVRAKARAMMDEFDRRAMTEFLEGHARSEELPWFGSNIRWISLEEARAMYPSNGQVVMACRPTLLCMAIREAATP